MAKKSGKFILNIGDEGGILTYIQGKEVTRRLFAATPNYSDTQAFVELLRSEPKAPIYMLVDMMDQSYVQHSLPPVSSLSINNLIKRKMERDFAADDLKGALRIGREKEGRRDWKYLFVTLSNSLQLQSWLDLVMEQPNHFVGIYLLPVEAEDFILRLQEGVTGRKIKRGKPTDGMTANWQLLVAHNKVGGFRQVVLKGGKLIFARLAQPIGDNQPEVIAGNIEQEISVTIEYLKRLGYTDEQGMDVYIVASEYIKMSIDPKNIHVASVHIYSPHEAALKLGLEHVTEPNDQFADVLMAAVFATARKHALKLQTKMQEKLNQLYMGLLGVKLGGALITVSAVAAAIYYLALVPGTKEDIEKFQSQTRLAEQELEQVKEQEKSLPDDLEKMTDLVSIHQQLNDLGMHPLDALSLYSQSMKNQTVLLRAVSWEVSDTVLSGGANAQQGGRGRGGYGGQPQPQGSKETLKLNLKIDMYGTEVGSQQFDQMVGSYIGDMKEAFSGFEVTLKSDRPGGQSKTTDFSLAEEARDPILEKPYYELEFDITGSGVVADKQGEQAAPAPRRRR